MDSRTLQTSLPTPTGLNETLTPTGSKTNLPPQEEAALKNIFGAADETPPAKQPQPKPTNEGLVAQWVSAETAKAIAGLNLEGVNQVDIQNLEDAVWQAALAGRLGDGQPSEMTSAAIQELVRQMAGGIPRPPQGPTVEPEPSLARSAETTSNTPEPEDELLGEPDRPVVPAEAVLPRRGADTRRVAGRGGPDCRVAGPGRATVLDRAVDEALAHGVAAGLEILLDADAEISPDTFARAVADWKANRLYVKNGIFRLKSSGSDSGPVAPYNKELHDCGVTWEDLHKAAHKL